MEDLAFFFDGTNMGKEDRSNIWKLYCLLKYHRLCVDNESTVTSVNKFVKYYQGPGKNEKGIDIGGIVFGEGFIQNLKRAYRDITNAVTQDELDLNKCRISLFGFSRGAYTARIFAHLLADCGVPDDIDYCDGIVDKYLPNQNPVSRKNSINVPKIQILGLFDTVRSTFKGELPKDKKLPSIVEDCRHAMSLDESRIFFPILKFDDASNNNRITCEWFSGVHIDVGGGTTRDGLSNITLNWMICAARAHGLNLPKTTNVAGCQTAELVSIQDDPLCEITPNTDLPEKSPRVYEGEGINPSVRTRIASLKNAYTPRTINFPSNIV